MSALAYLLERLNKKINMTALKNSNNRITNIMVDVLMAAD